MSRDVNRRFQPRCKPRAIPLSHIRRRRHARDVLDERRQRRRLLGEYEPFDFAWLKDGSGLPNDGVYGGRSVVLVHQVRDPPVAGTETLYAQVT
jgi:hypothetical protein